MALTVFTCPRKCYFFSSQIEINFMSVLNAFGGYRDKKRYLKKNIPKLLVMLLEIPKVM